MADTHLDREHWSKFASEWIVWASPLNNDAFWAYRESQSLENYIAALEAARLAVVSLREPMPEISDPKARIDLAHWGRIPLFLWLKARPLP
jgi:hypothetical protein